MMWFYYHFSHNYNKIINTSYLSITAKYESSLLFKSTRARIPSASFKGTTIRMPRSWPYFFTVIVAE